MAVRRLAETQPESFAFTAANRAWAERQIAKFPPGRQASAVIPLLWRAQEQEGWVTRPAIESVAQMLGMPLIRVLEVATFYTMFQLEPVGSKAHIQVCGTTPCMLRGSNDLIEVCRRRIHHDPHHLSSDGRLSWEEVECLGSCVNAPMIQVGSDTYEDLDTDIFEKLLDAFERGEAPPPGSQVGRQYSMPVSGQTTLKEIEYAADDVRPARANGSGAHARPHPETVPTAVDEGSAGGESLAAERARREGTGPQAGGGVDPSSAETADQEIGRVDPSGRSDEAASRGMGARAEGKDETPVRSEPPDTRTGERNPGARSQREPSSTSGEE